MINKKLDQLAKKYLLFKILKLIKRRSRLLIIKAIFLIKKNKGRQTILLFSEPRGGSTWLMEILMNIENSSVFFEPLHETKGVVSNILNGGYRLNIPHDEQQKEYYEIFKGIFSGTRISNYTTRSSTIKEYSRSEIYIIKFIKGNTLLPWITNQFNFKYKPVYLLRHPVATALSQYRAFYQAKDFDFSEHTYFNIIYNKEYKEYILNLDSTIEKLVALWCVYNKNTIYYSDEKWITVYYEHLLLNPEDEIERITGGIGIELPQISFDNLRKASETDYKKELKKDPIEQLKKWQTNFSEKELSNFQDILNFFEIKIYSCYEFLPQI